MKKSFQLLMLFSAVVCLPSCVSLREYEALQSHYTQATKSLSVANQELKELREENAELVRQGQAMTMSLSDMAAARQECEATVTSINRAYAALQLRYDTTMENFLQQITGKNRDLSKVNRMLEQRTRELNEKEQLVKQKEQAMLAQQQDLEEQLASLAQSELAANDALEAKQRELESLRVSVQKALVGFADKGAKIIALGLVHVSLLYLLTSYYLIIDRILLGFVICGFRDVITVLPLCMILGKIFGVYGMFAGAALAPIAAYYLSLLFVRVKYGIENTPLLLADREKTLKAVFYEFTITPEAIIAVQKNVGDFLRANNVDKKLISKTELLIEELYMLVYERNDKKPTVCAECTALIRDDGIQIIEKDDGALFDLTDEDSLPSSLGAFVVASYMEKMKGNKMYLTTMSYNRNTFRIR